MGIQDLEEEFQGGPRGVQDRETGLITGGVDVGESTSLRRSLRRGYTTELLNRGLDVASIEANNWCRKREIGRDGGEGLITIATYTQVENTLGIHLRY